MIAGTRYHCPRGHLTPGPEGGPCHTCHAIIPGPGGPIALLNQQLRRRANVRTSEAILGKADKSQTHRGALDRLLAFLAVRP